MRGKVGKSERNALNGVQPIAQCVQRGVKSMGGKCPNNHDRGSLIVKLAPKKQPSGVNRGQLQKDHNDTINAAAQMQINIATDKTSPAIIPFTSHFIALNPHKIYHKILDNS